MLRRAINGGYAATDGDVCVRACVCARVCPFIAGALLVWGNRFEGERLGDRRARTDGLLPSIPGERERERDVHPEYSRVLLLAHKLRLFSFPILPL